MHANRLPPEVYSTAYGYSHKVGQLADLTAIFEPEVQVCHFERPLAPAVQAELATLRDIRRLSLRSVCAVARPALIELAARLPPALGEDMCAQIELFGELLGCPSVGVRIEVLERAMCPRFHVDQCGIRLLCTYQGPGTEWIAPEVMADTLGQAAGDDVPQAAIEQATTGTLVLIKGARWQGNEAQGGIHRSPAISADAPPRVLLALDALWEH